MATFGMLVVSFLCDIRGNTKLLPIVQNFTLVTELQVINFMEETTPADNQL